MPSLYEFRIDRIDYCRLVCRGLATADRAMDLTIYLWIYILHYTQVKKIRGLEGEGTLQNDTSSMSSVPTWRNRRYPGSASFALYKTSLCSFAPTSQILFPTSMDSGISKEILADQFQQNTITRRSGSIISRNSINIETGLPTSSH